MENPGMENPEVTKDDESLMPKITLPSTALSKPDKSAVLSENYDIQTAKRVGISQMVCAALIFVVGLAGFLITNNAPSISYIREADKTWDYYWFMTYSYYSFDYIWGPIILIACGSCGLYSAKTRSVTSIFVNGLVSLLGIIICTGLVGLGLWAMYVDVRRVTKGVWAESGRDYKYDLPADLVPSAVAAIVTSSLFTLVSLVTLTLVVKSAVLSFRVIKCSDFKHLRCCWPCSCVLYLTCPSDETQRPTVLILNAQGPKSPDTIQFGGKTYIALPEQNNENHTAEEPLLQEENLHQDLTV